MYNRLSAGLEGLNQEMQTAQRTVETKADQAQLELLKKRLEEIEYCSKRTNIVI